MKNFLIILSLLGSVCLRAEMVRVVGVENARTLVVDRNGTRERIQLAGVAIVDEARAVQLLRWTVGTSWVLLEAQPGGGHHVYRSPDALFVNRELVQRGYARATQHGIEAASNLIVTYLGEFDPPATTTTAPPQTRSDTSGRSSASPRPKTRVRKAPRTAPQKRRGRP
jgi:hypothetical protein